jgi:DNA-binding MarR family transcriptional regulator
MVDAQWTEEVTVSNANTHAHADGTKASMIGALLHLGKTTRALMGLKLAEIGLCSGQDELLLALDEHGSQSVSNLAEIISVRPSTVSKMLDRLTECGYTARTGRQGDRRQTFVELTDDGRNMIGEIRDLHEQMDRELAHQQSDGRDVPGPSDIRELTVLMAARLRRLR